MKRTLYCTIAILVALCSNAECAPIPADDRSIVTEPFRAERMLVGAERPSDPNAVHFLQGVVAASRLEDDRARDELTQVFDAPGASPRLVAQALILAGTVALRSGNYVHARDLLRRAVTAPAEALDDAARTDAAQTFAVAAIVAGQARQTLERRTRGNLPLVTNHLRLVTVALRIAGRSVAAVVDTGANLSVLRAGLATRLGLRVLDGRATVGSSTTAVGTRVAIVDTLRIGPAVFHHVAFLVIDDAQLAPAGQRIDAIVGFPVLSALGRVSFRESGRGASTQRRLSFEPSDRRAAAGNLRFDGFTPSVRIEADDRPATLLVDSGATTSALGQRYADGLGERIATLDRKKIRVGGAGDLEEREVAILPRVDVNVAGRHVALSEVVLELASAKPEDNDGTLGTDVLWSRGGYTMDFGALSFSLAR